MLLEGQGNMPRMHSWPRHFFFFFVADLPRHETILTTTMQSLNRWLLLLSTPNPTDNDIQRTEACKIDYICLLFI